MQKERGIIMFQIKVQNKWIRAAIPALLLHCSIGTVYCWSLVSESIATYVGASKSTIEWAFSLAIFFLGMSAAFLGSFVEKDIHKSSLVATICFAGGMAGTGLAIQMKSVVGIFICYGVIMGIGLGTGYLSPVKTLMLWFKDRKGLATGLAVAGFGLAKAIASPIMEALQASVGIVNMFYVLAVVYFIMMFIGHILLAKPEGWVEKKSAKGEGLSIKQIFTNKTFLGIWIMFYINITCGLALISQEKAIVKAIGMAASVGLISSLTAIFNAGGRLGLSALADKMKDRNTIYKTIFVFSIAITLANIVSRGIVNEIAWLVIPLLLLINAGYGGGFSNVPTLLSDHFGMESISQIHGLVLSAWGIAGLTGNQLATFIVNHSGEFIDKAGYSVNPVGYQNVLYVTLALYVVAALVSFFVVPKPSKKK